MKIMTSLHQQRISFIDEFERGTLYKKGTNYHNLLITLKSNLDVNLVYVKKTVDILIKRHEVLRTQFLKEDGKLYQNILVSIESLIEVIVLKMNDETKIEEIIFKLCENSFENGIYDKLFKAWYIKTNKNIYLVFVFHHSICDFQTKSKFIQDFCHIFHALTKKEEYKEPLIELQYADFSCWQNDIPEEILEKNILYWKRKLSKIIEPLVLPIDRKRDEIHKYKSSQLKFLMKYQLIEKVNVFCEQNHFDKNIFFLSIYKILLHKYSTQNEINVGTSIIPSNIAELENTYGPVSNLVVLHDIFDELNSYSELYHMIESTYDEAIDNSIVPFEQLVMELKYKNDMSRTALFDVYYYYALMAREVTNEFEEISNNLGYGKYDYNLLVQDYGGEIEFILVYNKLYYSESTAKILMDSFFTILKQIIESKEIKLVDISVITPEHEDYILNNISIRQTSLISEQCIHEVFKKQVLNTPQNLSVKDNSSQFTYKELDALSDKIGIALRKQGINRNSICALIMEKSIYCISMMLGILKAGGAYLPINKELPIERIHYMIVESDPEIIIIDDLYIAKIDDIKNRLNNIISVTQLLEEAKDCTGDILNVNLSSDLAYIIYTSGTTGNPKGVLIEHKNVVDLIKNTTPLYNFNNNDIWTMFHEYNFDFSVWEMYGALLTGGMLLLLNKTQSQDTKLFRRILLDEGVTVLNQTPSAFYSLLMIESQEIDMLSLKYVVFGGEALNIEKIKDWRKKYPDVKMTNLYGITETTVHVTYKEIIKQDENAFNNIGKALPSYQVFIMDENHSIVPVGVSGEIVVGGSGVSRGYLKQEKLTRDRFIEHPYVQGERLYLSGDLARYKWNGELEYLGRKDEQVKIRGFRIELGEIETVIKRYKDVQDCVVIKRKDKFSEDALFAYIIYNGRLKVSDIHEFVKKKLPEYMVPSYIMQIEKIPLTLNGKTDTANLPEILLKSQNEYVAPMNEVQKRLCNIYEKVLGIENVGVCDNFFELGGHSLKAVKIINLIEEDFNVRANLKDLFKYPEIKDFSEIIQEKKVQQYEVPSSLDKFYVPAQQKQIYISEKFNEGSTQFNMPFALKINGVIQYEKLKDSIIKLFEVFDVFRMSFHMKDKNIIFKVHKKVEPEISIEEYIDDKSDLKQIYIDFVRPFDLSKAPLMRAKVLLEKEQKYSIILFDFHHIICDGISINIVMKFLGRAYTNQGVNEKPYPYAAYADWLNRRDITKERKYWLHEFKEEIQPLSLITDFSRMKELKRTSKYLEAELSVEYRSRLQDLCVHYSVTEYMFLLSSLMVLLGKYSGMNDIIVGSPISGRVKNNFEQAVGMFVNTLAIRGKINREETFLVFLTTIKEKCIGAIENQIYPIEELISELNIEKSPVNNPLFDIMFAMQNFDKVLIGENEDIEVLNFHNETAKYDLFFVAEENKNQGLDISLVYCDELFRIEMMDAMLDQWKNLICKLIDDPLAIIERVPLSRQPIFEQKIYKEQTSLNKTFIEMFHLSAEKFVNRNALISTKDEWSYKEFYDVTKKTAQYLKNRNLKKGDAVAFLVERSIEIVPVIYATIMIGCIYVPIDPDIPKIRMDYILEDSDAKAIIVSENTQILVKNSIVMTIINISEINLEELTYGNDQQPCLDDKAYIIYTSGTTGNPKGVVVSHRALSNIILNLESMEPCTDGTRYLLKTNYTFDVSISELFGWYLSGGSLIILDKDQEKDLEKIIRFVQKYHVTHINFVPSMLTAFLNYLRVSNERLDSLKYLLIAGEAFPPDTARESARLLPEVFIENLYGPTEATVYATRWKVERYDYMNMPIGKALDNVRTYIANNNETVCGVGEIGELLIAGDGLALGYQNQEMLTKSKFQPYKAVGEDRVYHTGDLCRYLWNGDIEYIGRMDTQVKIRGYRIELAEIENVLREVSGITNAFAIAKASNLGLKTIYAYYCGEVVDENKLRQHMCKFVPAYMIPAFFIHIEKVPLTLSGKVDRAKFQTVEITKKINLPSSELEKSMFQIWAEVLGNENIGKRDAFFEIGGDSLKALILIDLINQKFNVSFNVQDIFRYVNIEMLCNRIQEENHVICDQDIEEIEF